MREYFHIQLLAYKYEAWWVHLNRCAIYFMFFVIGVLFTGKVDLLVDIFVIIIFLSEFTAALFLYNIPIRIKTDLKFNKLVKRKIKLEKIDIENVFTGGKDHESRIRIFFPKKTLVNRYKLCYIYDGRFDTVRLLLDCDNRDILKSFIEKAVENEKLTFNISYLRFSKVLYEITPCEDSVYKKEQQELIDSVFVLEKPIGLINGFRFANNRK